MNTLTPRQKHLICCFKSLGLNQETTVAIMAFLDTMKKREQMEKFLVENLEKKHEPTEQEILKKVAEIVKQ